jgi:disulfide oxidoreductase YuzD
LVKGYIERVYGDRVSVDYYDAAEPAVRTDFNQVVAQAEEHYWPYPLVLVNEKPVMAGHVDAYGLMGLLREEFHLEQGA